MPVPVTEDLKLTHAYLNTPEAGYQGLYVSANVLEQVHYGSGIIDSSSELKEVLDWLAAPIQRMWQGTPVFRGREAEVPDEGKAVRGFFDLLRKRLAGVVVTLARALRTLEERDDAEAAKFAVASVAQQAYARDHFVAGLVGYGEAFGVEEVADRWRQHTLSCQAEVAEANGWFARLKAGPVLDPRGRIDLWNTAANLVGVFKLQHADMQRIEARRGVSPAWAYLGIRDDAAAAWTRLGMDPLAAGPWWAFGVAPADVAGWLEAGFVDPVAVGGWKVRAFDTAEAAAWRDARFRPDEAFSYMLDGCRDPASAAALREQRRAGAGGGSPAGA